MSKTPIKDAVNKILNSDEFKAFVADNTFCASTKQENEIAYGIAYKVLGREDYFARQCALIALCKTFGMV